MVRRQRENVVPEDVGCESLQRTLRPDLDEHAGAGVVQRPQSPHELDRRSHLGGQQVEHLGDDARAHGVQLSGHVRHDRELG